MDNYRVIFRRGFKILESTEPDFPKFYYSSKVSSFPEDDVLDDWSSPSSLIIFAFRFNSGLGLNGKHSSHPLMFSQKGSPKDE
jgi:hypothetical protein